MYAEAAVGKTVFDPLDLSAEEKNMPKPTGSPKALAGALPPLRVFKPGMLLHACIRIDCTASAAAFVRLFMWFH